MASDWGSEMIVTFLVAVLQILTLGTTVYARAITPRKSGRRRHSPHVLAEAQAVERNTIIAVGVALLMVGAGELMAAATWECSRSAE